MPNERLLDKIDRRIVLAEEGFEAEKRALFASTTDQAQIQAGRVYLKSLEQSLADLHAMRVSLAKDDGE